jgi:hypothetical protein
MSPKKPILMNPPPSAPPTAPAGHPWLLTGLGFLLGAMLAGLWFHHPAARPVAAGLSAPTQKLLGQLAVPVAIHFYAVLPGGSDPSLPAYAGRVGRLLTALQAAGGGKMSVTISDTPAEANAASADGVQAFNLDQGGACFLGLTLVSGTNHETLARLQPEWEPALEADLARAIVRVAAAAAPPPPPREVAQPDPEIVASIHRLIPDLTATPEQTADQIFHTEFMREMADAGTELEAQMHAAQERVTQAQTGGTSAELEAARKNLAQVQMAQGEKIKQIAARLQTRLAVFQRLKAAAAK